MGTQIRFWEGSYKNAAKTAEAGLPVFDTVPWCEIRVSGESDTVNGPWHKMSQAVQEKWSASFEKWQKDHSTEGIVGTILSEVPWLGVGEVETFKVAGLRTLEELSNVADGSITKFPGGIEYRQKARDTLRMAKESAPMQKMSAELAKRDEEIQSLKVQIAEILAAREANKGKR